MTVIAACVNRCRGRGKRNEREDCLRSEGTFYYFIQGAGRRSCCPPCQGRPPFGPRSNNRWPDPPRRAARSHLAALPCPRPPTRTGRTQRPLSPARYPLTHSFGALPVLRAAHEKTPSPHAARHLGRSSGHLAPAAATSSRSTIPTATEPPRSHLGATTSAPRSSAPWLRARHLAHHLGAGYKLAHESAPIPLSS